MNIYALMDFQKKMIEAMFNPYLNACDLMFASWCKANIKG